MPTKKKQNSKRKTLQSRVRWAGTTVLVVSIVLVAYLLIRDNEHADANLTAPVGTTARSSQIDSSELTQESSLDSNYDGRYALDAQGDDTAMQQIGEVVPHE